MPRILVIENQQTTRALLEGRFNGGLSIQSAATVQDGFAAHIGDPFDLVIWDTVSAPPECFTIAKTVKKFLKSSAPTRTIVVSDTREPNLVCVRNMRCEWLRLPLDEKELLALVETMIRFSCIGTGEQDQAESANSHLPLEFEGLMAFTLTMRSVIQNIVEAAAEDIPVLITGETGTGKDLVAAAIHKRSKRKSYPYLPVNMGAIASELIASELFGHERGAYTGASEARAGLFEQAQGGTIFLDEITTMDEKTQVSLLRVLETKTIRRVRGEKDIHTNVRVIAATNENIEEAVKAGRFREDLYYRLDVFRIHLPPLRERHGAVSLFTDHFVARFAEMYKKELRVVSRDTYRVLRAYSWPGNVRELKNVIQRAVLLAKGAELTPGLLPQRIRETTASEGRQLSAVSPIQLGMTLGDVEKEYIKLTLSAINGNKKKAASLLGISRRALYNKLKRFQML
jgi:DNA-binding NtrC family response regulator